VRVFHNSGRQPFVTDYSQTNNFRYSNCLWSSPSLFNTVLISDFYFSLFPARISRQKERDNEKNSHRSHYRCSLPPELHFLIHRKMQPQDAACSCQDRAPPLNPTRKRPARKLQLKWKNCARHFRCSDRQHSCNPGLRRRRTTALLRGWNSTATLPGVNDCHHRYQRDWRLRFSLRQQHRLRGSSTVYNRSTRSRRHLRGQHQGTSTHLGKGPPSVGCPFFLSIPCAYFKQPLLCESFSIPSPLFRIFNKLSSACNTPVMATPHTEG
jgi:hypothetical protein